MTLSQKTKSLLRDLITADEEKRAIERDNSASDRATKAADRFESTVKELLFCMEAKNGQRHSH